VPSFSDYIVFVDESGDHGLETIDPNYPVFVLAFCIFEKEAYLSKAVPAVLRFKFKYFGHDQAILHERDIRRGHAPFAFTRDRNVREGFFEDLNQLVRDVEFRLVASVIRKDEHRARYAVPDNPYHIAMGFGLERVFLDLHGRGCREGRTHVLCERRGAPEDTQLELEIRRVCDNNATGQELPFEPLLVAKTCNSSGLQLADLVARPIGRKVMEPKQANRAFDIIKPKFRCGPAGEVSGYGLKVFP
jgi:Protein of unknown function (DUF3800)